MRKGFTLVEILAVIVVLSLILIVTAPTIMKSRGTLTNALTDKEKKNVEDAARLLAIDLDDFDSDIYNCSDWISSLCTKRNNKWSKIANLTVGMLKSHDYFVDNSKHIKENCKITIEKKDANNYEISLNSSTC